jgi:diacylglycerol kinase
LSDSTGDRPFGKPRNWVAKFGGAFRGLRCGVRGQNSFAIHVPMAVAVMLLAAALRVDRLEWCLLLLSITVVLAAELLNSALETLAKAIDRQYNPHLADGLDIASGAVLISSLGAVLVGLLILGTRLQALFLG